jgi:hypothetical protein
MLGGRARAIAISGAEHDREVALAAEHVADLAGLVDHLVEGHEAEGHRAVVDHRPKAAAG